MPATVPAAATAVVLTFEGAPPFDDREERDDDEFEPLLRLRLVERLVLAPLEEELLRFGEVEDELLLFGDALFERCPDDCRVVEERVLACAITSSFHP